MPLIKQPVAINFSQGLDTKTDPNQLPIGKFSSLVNSVFDTDGRLTKVPGALSLPALPDTSINTLTTFNGGLTALDNSLYSYSSDTKQWLNKGATPDVKLGVQSLIRSSNGQSRVDAQVASNGLACVVYLDVILGHYFYAISDVNTGSQVVAQTALPSSPSAVSPRVFILGNYFIITYLQTISGVTHIEYIAIPMAAPSNPSAAASLTNQVSGLTAGYDGFVINKTLFIAWDGSAMGGAINIVTLTTSFTISHTASIAGFVSSLMVVTADLTKVNPIIWISWWSVTDGNIWTVALTSQLQPWSSVWASGPNIAPIAITNNASLTLMTAASQGNTILFYYEVRNTYGFSSARTDYISASHAHSDGTFGVYGAISRGVGLASKAFYQGDNLYVLLTYGQMFQPTYFLAQLNFGGQAKIAAKIAYANGGGYLNPGSNVVQVLPSASVYNDAVYIPYLFRDLVEPLNKANSTSNGQAALYTQTGINIVNFTFDTTQTAHSEIGGSLHLGGGILWQYDGRVPVEHGFHVWPEDLLCTQSTAGNLIDQQYYYAVTYEWTDAAGNIHRSAPSIPFGVTVSAGGGTASVVLNIPTLRLTYKLAPNPVRIVIYRWSTANPVFYSVFAPTYVLANDTSADSVTYTDTLSDSSIAGGVILYTTGGVVENIAAPASNVMTLSQNRLMLLDAEDPNLVWFSKQVIASTPVEMSDLLALYIAPTQGTQGSTGPTRCLFSMDDKTLLFKDNAIYYFTGQGPDNTGNNSDFTPSTYITSSVGCNNPASLVLMPNGVMFQSNKGIWLLGRDLSTTYVGAPVEAFNSAIVTSAVTVPNTNQVRFTLSTGITLMYDYFYDRWDVLNKNAKSSTIYQGLHTYIDSNGNVFQETPEVYYMGTASTPVLMGFTTGWINMAGLQGFERAYYFTLLAKYLSPHKLQIGIAYDYDDTVMQTNIITPTNFSGAYGSDPSYGASGTYGGSSQVEWWRIFFQKQKCTAIKISVQELFDASLGVPPGAGFTCSGINIVIGAKKAYRTFKAQHSTG